MQAGMEEYHLMEADIEDIETGSSDKKESGKEKLNRADGTLTDCGTGKTCWASIPGIFF